MLFSVRAAAWPEANGAGCEAAPDFAREVLWLPAALGSPNAIEGRVRFSRHPRLSYSR